MKINFNLLDLFLGIDKTINITINYPSIVNIIFILFGLYFSQYILYYSCIYYIYNNIEIQDLHLLLQYNFNSSIKVISYFENICNNIKFTPIVRIQFILYSIFSILNLFHFKIHYYIFSFILGYIFYLYIIPNFITYIKNPKKLAFFVYSSILFIYIFDLFITINLTLKICNLYYEISLLNIVDIYTILRIPAKYKWILCLINLFLSIITFDNMNNILWLLILTIKFSFRYDIDMFLQIFFQYDIMNKIKDILWNSLGYLPSYLWNSIKSNILSLYNNPKEWFYTEGITFKKTIEDINTKQFFINKFIKKLEKYQKHSFTKLFSKYYFLLHFFIIYLTTISFIYLYNINTFFISLFTLSSFTLNSYYYSEYTIINFDQRLTNILWQIDNYTTEKLSIVKNIIQSIYTTKTTACGTILGATTGGFIGYTISSFFYATLSSGTSLVFAGIGSLYLGYNNYTKSNLENLKKIKSMYKNNDIKMIEMESIN